MKDRVVKHPSYYIRRMYLKSDLAIDELVNRLGMDKDNLNKTFIKEKIYL